METDLVDIYKIYNYLFINSTWLQAKKERENMELREALKRTKEGASSLLNTVELKVSSYCHPL